MAVSSPFAPNLSGSYGNVQEALAQSAQIAGKNTGVMGSLAAGLQPVSELAKTRGEDMWKATLEDQLNKNKAQYVKYTKHTT